MKTINTHVGIEASAELAWKILADLDGWSRWNPLIHCSGGLIEGEKIIVTLRRPGAEDIVSNPTISFVADGEEFRWKAAFYPLNLIKAEHGFRIVEEENNRCRLEHFENFSGLLAGAMLRKNHKLLELGFITMNRAFKRESERMAREKD